MSKNEALAPYSMYAITAKLFTCVEKEVRHAFGDAVTPLLSKGVANVGLAEMRAIADIASLEKEVHRLHAYIPSQIEPSSHLTKDHTVYAWMAKLFASVTKEVVTVYGERGQDAIRQGVHRFGHSRGQGIANRAAHLGLPNTIDNYLSNYDMERSDLFEVETTFHPNVIEQTFTVCPFGQQWKEDGTGEYGILYCQVIDPAIAQGYNEDFTVVHDEYVLKEGQCHFRFSLPKSN